MKRFISACLLTSLLLFPLFGYTYEKGREDGVAQYKRSRSFMLTLFSMYKYGVQDGIALCQGGK